MCNFCVSINFCSTIILVMENTKLNLTPTKENKLPSNIEAEQSLIGSVLVNNDIIDEISNNKVMPIIQNHKNRTLAPKINKEDLIINWNNNANYINNKIKAFDPHPGAFTFFEGKRIKLFESKLFESIESIVSLENNGDFIFKDGLIFIKCVKNYLSVNSVQLEGKKRISSIDFCNNLKDKNQHFD